MRRNSPEGSSWYGPDRRRKREQEEEPLPREDQEKLKSLIKRTLGHQGDLIEIRRSDPTFSQEDLERYHKANDRVDMLEAIILRMKTMNRKDGEESIRFISKLDNDILTHIRTFNPHYEKGER